MPEPRTTPGGGHIIAEGFADAEGRSGERDYSTLASIDVTRVRPDGQIERVYGVVR